MRHSAGTWSGETSEVPEFVCIPLAYPRHIGCSGSRHTRHLMADTAIRWRNGGFLPLLGKPYVGAAHCCGGADD